jgi:hypothetical protein
MLVQGVVQVVLLGIGLKPHCPQLSFIMMMQRFWDAVNCCMNSWVAFAGLCLDGVLHRWFIWHLRWPTNQC